MPSKKEGSEIPNKRKRKRRKVTAKSRADEYLSVTGDRHKVIMTPTGIMMEDGLVLYKNIVRIYKKKDTDFYGYAKIRIWFTSGKITVRKVNSAEATRFILAVRKKMKELEKKQAEDSLKDDPIFF
ncbi:hypothetical protein [Methanobacterium sp.]|jgi:hypothetical protein|uniref:hypothetical protein n=1 Tax=Methanobacterium sp. TaxID=2164 RepID=UPI00315935E4